MVDREPYALELERLAADLIADSAARDLDKLRSFRLFLRHAYSVDLDPEELVRTAGYLAAVHPRLRSEMRSFGELLLKRSSAPGG